MRIESRLEKKTELEEQTHLKPHELQKVVEVSVL